MEHHTIVNSRAPRSRRRKTRSKEKDSTGLAEDANSPPSASPPAPSPPAAPLSGQEPLPSNASSLTNFEGHKPFWEPDYPSQRFRPGKPGAGDLRYSPPPQLFSPPISPNELHLQHITAGHATTAVLSVNVKTMASSPDSDEGLKPSAFVPVYKGLTFTPRSDLTAYAAFADRSKLQDASAGGVYTIMNAAEAESDAAEKTYAADNGLEPATDAMTRTMSKQSEGKESHLSSEAEIHPCEGVPVSTFDGDVPTMSEHQVKSFEELETERGIREWNNTVFDERWLDPTPPIFKQPDDRWQATIPGFITGKQIEQTSSKHHSHISFLRDLEETRKKMDLPAHFRPDPLIWAVNNRAPTPERIVLEEHPAHELVPEPLWLGRLHKVVCELEGGMGELPRGITERPAVIRRYFYNRVFLEGWEWVGSDEQKLTKSGGRIRSVGAVRDHALKDIEDLVSFMTAPVGHGIRKVTFPRTPEAAVMMKEDPFGGNSADPREEHFMRRFRRIGGYADFTSLGGFEGRNAMAEAMGIQPTGHTDSIPDVHTQPRSPASTALAQHEIGQNLASDETGRVGQMGAQKHTPAPNRSQPSGSRGSSDPKDRKSYLPGIHASSTPLAGNESSGASGLDGRILREEHPAGHNNEVKITAVTTGIPSLGKNEHDKRRAASEHPSLSQENRSSSQATLTAESNDNMEPSLYHLMDDLGVGPDANSANHTQYSKVSASPYATQVQSENQQLPVNFGRPRMFERSGWEDYVPPSSVIEPIQTQQNPRIPSGPPSSTMHPGSGHQQSNATPHQVDYAKFEPPAYETPQDVHRPYWQDAHFQWPTELPQQPLRSIARWTATAGITQTAYSSPPQTFYAGPHSMQSGFPQRAVGPAGSSTTGAESSSAYDAPDSRYAYVTQGMINQPGYSWKHHTSHPLSYKNVGARAPAPNRFAAVLARSREFENYGIPQVGGTPIPNQAFRGYQNRGTPDVPHTFPQNQARSYPVPSEVYFGTPYGRAPSSSQASVQNPMHGTSNPPQAFGDRRIPAPNAAHMGNQYGQVPTSSQALPQYPIHGTPAPFQSLPESHNRSTRTPTQVLQNTYDWQSRFGIPQDMVKPDLPILHYRDGSDDMCPHHAKEVPTIAFQNLARNFPPTYEALRAAENLPFAEVARDMKPVEWGVLKIGNIPYDITKDLVASFLGHHAKLITANLGPAIHVIMDRSSGKTMDCFVEFLSSLDARATCNSINLRQRGLIRISDRVVDVNMSSQNELLATLFPKAKDVKWVNGKPIVMQPEEEWSSGFKSFVSAEELGLLVKHAEQPHRSNYTQRSPQRCYESMISLLAKFPWHSVENYTLQQRDLIFNAARQMLHILSINIRKQHGRSNHSRGDSSVSFATALSHGSSDRNPGIERYSSSAITHSIVTDLNPGSRSAEGLTENLLKDLLSAGLNAAGFSENQRWQLYEACEYAKHHFLLSPVLQYWPFEVLGRKMRIEEDVIELYAQIIAYNPEVEQTGFPFGHLRNITARLDMETQTMEKMGSIELKILDHLLKGGVEHALAQQQAERDMAALTL